MATDMAALAGVLGINEYHRHTGFACLVLDEATQLGESPAMHLGALWLTKPCTRADVLESLKRNTALGVLRRRNERLTNLVVHGPTKPGFSAGHALQRTTDVLGPLESPHGRHGMPRR